MAGKQKKEWVIDEWDDSLDSHAGSGSGPAGTPPEFQASDDTWDDIPPEWQKPPKQRPGTDPGGKKKLFVVLSSAVAALLIAVAVLHFTGIINFFPSGSTVSPGPDTTASIQLKTPEPVVTDTPTPKPVTTDAPTPEPVVTDAPTPEPVITDAPTPKPVTTDAPTPEPTPVSDVVRNEWYGPEMRYYYQFLTDHEKEVFDTVYTAAVQFRTDVSISYSSEEEIKRVFFVLWRDCPELFNRDSYYQYTNTKVSLKYRMDQAQYSKICSRIHAVFDTMASSFPEGGDDFEKQLVIYRYLIENCDYLCLDDGSTAHADACLYYGKSQCSGYAAALSLALRHFGIKAVVLSNPAHEWNMVCINGRWYNCDATWDDTGTEGYRIPFDPSQDEYNAWMNLPDRLYALKSDHRPDREPGFPLPEAVSIQDSYAKRKGAYIPPGETDVAARIDSCLKQAERAGKHHVLIMLDDQSYVDNWDSVIEKVFRIYNDYGWSYFSPDPSNRCIYMVYGSQ